MVINRAIVIVLDGLGVGALPDAAFFGDEEANTLGHLFMCKEKMRLPHLFSLGLGKLLPEGCCRDRAEPKGAFGRMAERSPGKDTTSGHWELAGMILREPFPVYRNGFPEDVIATFEKLIGCKILGNVVASGTDILKELGLKHLETGFPIVYTSVDSVFQVAAHEEIVPVETLYEWCRIAREEVLVGEHAVGRVIARPFRGTAGSFYRTERRRDFSLPPPGSTLLDLAAASGMQVWAAGKVKDIFAGRGVTKHLSVTGNIEILREIKDALEADFRGILWATLVDFDMLYGHRNDTEGFTRALEEFDRHLGEILPRLKTGDMLFITADHGCDPTHKGTDHTREYVPLLVWNENIRPVDLQTRESFADLGATIAELLQCSPTADGTSFAGKLLYKGDFK